MQYSSHLTTVEIVGVQEDYFGPFARIKAQLLDGEIEIRWGLDKYTYEHLRKVVQYGFSSNVDYRCMLLVNSGSKDASNRCVCNLMCQIGTQWIRMEFLCSALFLSNLQWLRRVNTVQDLYPLSWDRWIESEYNLLYTGNIPADYIVPAEVENKRATATNFMRRLVIVAAFVLLGAGVVLGLVAFGHSYQRGISIFSPSHLFSFMAPESAKEPIGKSQQQSAASQNMPATPVLQKRKLASKGQLGNAHPPKTYPTTPTVHFHGVSEIYKVPPEEVALTFNGGPSPYTEQIVQELSKYHAHATFFFIGSNVMRIPNAVQYVVKNGDAIGDQTIDYPDLATMSAPEQQREMLGGIRIINRFVTIPIVLFRPPYDFFNHTTERLVEQHHLVLALWNKDPRDWAASSAQQVIRSVLHSSASGGVFNLQDNKVTTLALPTILETLQSQHLKFVALFPSQR